MITQDEAGAWIAAYGEAWVTRDPDKVVRLFTAGATYQERRFRQPLVGAAAIRDYWQVIVHDLQRDIGFAAGQTVLGGDQAFVHWRAHFTWRPIAGILELDAVSRITFSAATGDGRLRLATSFEEWIESREG